MKLRNGRDEPGAPLPGMRKLVRDLFTEVPRKNDNEIGLLRLNPLRCHDRDMAPWQIPALLVRTQVGNELDQLVSFDSTIVEQGVAFGGGAVADNL